MKSKLYVLTIQRDMWDLLEQNLACRCSFDSCSPSIRSHLFNDAISASQKKFQGFIWHDWVNFSWQFMQSIIHGLFIFISKAHHCNHDNVAIPWEKNLQCKLKHASLVIWYSQSWRYYHIVTEKLLPDTLACSAVTPSSPTFMNAL